MKILVLEPDALLGGSYQVALQAAGHQVNHVRNAQEAVFQLDQQSPDLIVLEVQMANHNGVEFLYELRSYPEWQHIPVLLHSFITPQQLSRRRFADLGVVGYLYKPTTSLEQFVQLVGRHLPVSV